jgi:small-conductance mechanosensitive channel
MKGGVTAKLNFAKMEGLLNKALMIVSVCIWLIVFTISLNMYNLLFFKLRMFLTTQRTVGSTSFQVGNILLFIAIIYISNLLQQGVGSLYGKADHSWDPEVKKNGSRLAMTRLVLIVIGFLIAIAASGIPMDKITIVLGALGVGIGLGLQGIVNNLVSGVILIFEQPFRIGDFIEVGDKKGRVLDIGIRSSKIVMEEGAEIIMPNADLLSGRVINWTMRNENMRIELPLSVEKGHSFDEIEKAIIEELEKSEHVVKNMPPEILLTSQSEKAMNINVLIWINDVHKLGAIKSQLLNSLYTSLAQKEIKII